MRLIAVITSAVTAWYEEERDRAPVWLPVFMGAGVLLYYTLRFEPPLWVGAAVALPALVMTLRVTVWLAPVAALATGFAAAQLATARAPPMLWQVPTHATIVTGTVRAVEALPEGRRVTIRPAWLDGAEAPLDRAVRIRLRPKDDSEIATGDGIRLRALIRPPASPAYPGGWDLQRDAYYAGLGASGYALGKLERTQEAVPSGPMRLVQRLREAIAGRVTAVIPGAAGAVSVTLLTGASMAIPEADHAAFRDSGLAHLLAVAGLHIGIVMGFALMLARSLLALHERISLHWPAKKLAAACALAAGGAYMVLTGMHVPIIRSFTMACLFTVAVMLDRRPFSLRGLGLAAVMLMLIAPQEVPNVSFQMSFSAVLALIAGYEALRPWLRRLHGTGWWRKSLSHLVALALTSALAGSASAPFGAYHFGQVQLYFILANMVAVPLTAVWVMPAGLIALMLMPLHLEVLALVPMGWGAQLVVWVARGSAALPAATAQVPHMPAWGLAVFSLGLAWLGIWRTRGRLLGVPVMLAGVASVFWAHPPDLLVSGDARMIAVRTGQGAFLQQAQGGSRFVRDAWAAYWAVPRFVPVAEAAAGGAVSCAAGGCLLRPYPERPGAWLVQQAERRSDCTGISVIVSAEPARGLCPKPWPRLVDRFTVWRSGSAAVWLEGTKARVLTDREERGDRPWVPPPPVPKKAPVPKLPMAGVETVEPAADPPMAPERE